MCENVYCSMVFSSKEVFVGFIIKGVYYVAVRSS